MVRVMNWNVFATKRSQPNAGTVLAISLEELRKPRKTSVSIFNDPTEKIKNSTQECYRCANLPDTQVLFRLYCGGRHQDVTELSAVKLLVSFSIVPVLLGGHISFESMQQFV
jgi:hypothetical protein